jgi:hypothetical protein
MLAISSQQFAKIQEVRNEALCASIAEALCVIFPESAPSRAEVVEEIRPLVAEASENGIVGGELIAQHVYASKVFGVGYWQRAPLVGNLIWDSTLEESLRHAWLLEWMDAMKIMLRAQDRRPT